MAAVAGELVSSIGSANLLSPLSSADDANDGANSRQLTGLVGDGGQKQFSAFLLAYVYPTGQQHIVVVELEPDPENESVSRDQNIYIDVPTRGRV